MEENSSPKVYDQSLGSDGSSPYGSTSTSGDSSCGECSPDKPSTFSAGANESPLGSVKQSSPIAQLMERTGYSIVQQNGQRRYGPPPDWEGEAPSRGCEVFVGKIPRDCFEDELVPVFDKMGKIYELRLMMDYTGQNRGYAFVVYGEVASAKESVRQLNNYEIRKGRTLGVCMSVDNCRLFVGGIPKKMTKEDIKQEVQKVTEGVVDVIVYPSAADKTKNRGFAFVEYDSHRAAAMARRKLMNGRVYLWGHQLAVDWAEPEVEVDEEIMAQVKVLYVRNLMLSTTESTIEEVFSCHAPVERVKKIRDYAFVHFHSKEDAHKAMGVLNGSILDGAEIEVMLAKPVDKDSYPRSPKFNRMTTVPALSFIPVDNYGTMLPAIYPGTYPISPKYMVRNSMGTCTMVRMMRGSRGRGSRGFFPVQMVQPSQRLVMPPTSLQPSFYSNTQSYFDAKHSVEESLSGAGYVEVQPSPTHTFPTAGTVVTQGQIVPKPTKNRVQFLEEVCAKNSWSSPLYTLHSSYGTSDNRLFVYKVTLPSIGVSYMPHKLSRTSDEAKSAAAEYALSQLGFCNEGPHVLPVPPVLSVPTGLQVPPAPSVPSVKYVGTDRTVGTERTLGTGSFVTTVPVTATPFPATLSQPLPLADSSPTYAHPATAYTTPKLTSWGGSADASAAMYAPPPLPDPYISQQTYAAAAHQEIYHQSLHAPHQHGF